VSQHSSEPYRGFAATEIHQSDPKKIAKLIEQLNRDLTETQKNASKRRQQELRSSTGGVHSNS